MFRGRGTRIKIRHARDARASNEPKEIPFKVGGSDGARLNLFNFSINTMVLRTVGVNNFSDTPLGVLCL